MNEFIMVQTTVPNCQVAKDIARKLIEQSLCACINIIPLCHSIYCWDGIVCENEEAILIIKTVGRNYHKLEEDLKKIHPYDVPEIIAIDIKQGFNDYLTWITKNSNYGTKE